MIVPGLVRKSETGMNKRFGWEKRVIRIRTTFIFSVIYFNGRPFQYKHLYARKSWYGIEGGRVARRNRNGSPVDPEVCRHSRVATPNSLLFIYVFTGCVLK